jgi:hypothetical protein
MFWKNWMVQFLADVECMNLFCSSAKPEGPVLETAESKISRSSKNLGETMMDKPDDWRTPMVRYIENPGHIVDRKVQRQALKYVVLDNTLYR